MQVKSKKKKNRNAGNDEVNVQAYDQYVKGDKNRRSSSNVTIEIVYLLVVTLKSLGNFPLKLIRLVMFQIIGYK